MKKVLLATSALTLLAGAAAAQVSVSGSARMGITSTAGVTASTYRTRVNFTMSGETDGGLTFGAFTRVNINGGTAAAGNSTITSNATTVPFSANNQGIFSGSRVWVSNGTATLTIGNAGGATSTNGNIWGCGVGFTGSCADMPNPNFSWASFSSGGAGANVIRLDFALGSANVSLSGGNGNDTEIAASFALGSANIGVSHDVGAGTTGGTQLHVGMDAGSANIGIHYAQDNAGATGYTITASMGVGAGSLSGFAGSNINSAAVYGMTYSQSLGGGATAAVSLRSVAGTITTDAGVKFSF